jgi:hypothetical protein
MWNKKAGTGERRRHQENKGGEEKIGKRKERTHSEVGVREEKQKEIKDR